MLLEAVSRMLAAGAELKKAITVLTGHGKIQ
jgi:hypothetical protein